MPSVDRLPEQLLPDLRAKWIKLAGAREVAQHALTAAQAIEADYQQALNLCLRMLGKDPNQNYRVNLETGAIEETAVENGVAPPLPPVPVT